MIVPKWIVQTHPDQYLASHSDGILAFTRDVTRAEVFDSHPRARIAIADARQTLHLGEARVTLLPEQTCQWCGGHGPCINTPRDDHHFEPRAKDRLRGAPDEEGRLPKGLRQLFLGAQNMGWDIKTARAELAEMLAWQRKAFRAHPNLDRDIELLPEDGC